MTLRRSHWKLNCFPLPNEWWWWWWWWSGLVICFLSFSSSSSLHVHWLPQTNGEWMVLWLKHSSSSSTLFSSIKFGTSSTKCIIIIMMANSGCSVANTNDSGISIVVVVGIEVNGCIQCTIRKLKNVYVLIRGKHADAYGSWSNVSGHCLSERCM